MWIEIKNVPDKLSIITEMVRKNSKVIDVPLFSDFFQDYIDNKCVFGKNETVKMEQLVKSFDIYLKYISKC